MRRTPENADRVSGSVQELDPAAVSIIRSEGLKANYPMFNSAERRNIVLGLLESVGLDRSQGIPLSPRVLGRGSSG